MKMSILPRSWLILSKAEEIEGLLETSAVTTRTVALGAVARMLEAVEDRVDSVRPMRAILEAPATAKALAMAAPIPLPPPVTTTVLFAWESEGWLGSMAG